MSQIMINVNAMRKNYKRGMKLMTKTVQKSLPKLYANENIPQSKQKVRVKYFDCMGSWTWYATEYDPEQKLFFGFVDGFDGEWGYFSLAELESVNTVERDLYFKPKPAGEIPKIKCYS